jgi:small subunit ribosomal protein S6
MKRFEYETMYILRPDLGDEQTDRTIDNYQGFLRDRGVEKIQTQHRGKRRLAYEIDRQREGIYVQMNYQCDGQLIAQLERAMRQSDDVLRYLTIKQEIREEQPEEAEAQA